MNLSLSSSVSNKFINTVFLFKINFFRHVWQFLGQKFVLLINRKYVRNPKWWLKSCFSLKPRDWYHRQNISLYTVKKVSSFPGKMIYLYLQSRPSYSFLNSKTFRLPLCASLSVIVILVSPIFPSLFWIWFLGLVFSHNGTLLYVYSTKQNLVLNKNNSKNNLFHCWLVNKEYNSRSACTPMN